MISSRTSRTCSHGSGRSGGLLHGERGAGSYAPVGAATEPGASVGELNPGFSNTPFKCVHYALGAMIPTGTLMNADMSLAEIACRRVVMSLRLLRELRVAAQLLSSTSWAAANTSAVTNKWNGSATANPLSDIYSLRQNSLLPVTTIVMGEAVEPFLFAATTNATNRIQQFVQAGGQLPRVVVARAKSIVNGVPQYIWAPTLPANAVLLREPSSDSDIPSARTLRWVGDARDGDVVGGMLVRTFTEPSGGSSAKSWVVVAHADAEIVVSNQVGALLTGVIQ